MQEAATPNSQLPPIPGKRYFTIGEVSDLCGVKTHVLRYWEQEFPSLKPMKRRGNRRYYQREDVLLIRQIRALLYEQGYTISGARQKLLEDAHNPPPAQLPPEPIVVDGQDFTPVVQELERILYLLRG
ncbi:MAG: MerR family transcriptional regulator [Thiothrix sp.]